MRVATLFNNVAVEIHVVHKNDDDVDNLCITRWCILVTNS